MAVFRRGKTGCGGRERWWRLWIRTWAIRRCALLLGASVVRVYRSFQRPCEGGAGSRRIYESQALLRCFQTRVKDTFFDRVSRFSMTFYSVFGTEEIQMYIGKKKETSVVNPSTYFFALFCFLLQRRLRYDSDQRHRHCMRLMSCLFRHHSYHPRKARAFCAGLPDRPGASAPRDEEHPSTVRRRADLGYEIVAATADRQNFGKCCSFSAVSAPIFASKYAFFRIFQNLPDYPAEIV